MPIDIPLSDKKFLQGVIDMHVHAAPDLFERPFDELELARQAASVGYRAIVFKSHFTMNCDRAYLINKMVPGIEVFGGIILNYAVGGLNPDAVEAAIGLGGKVVWMGSLQTAHHIQHMGGATYPRLKLLKEKAKRIEKKKGITIFSPEGTILPEVYEIIELVADADIVLATGHLSLNENFALIKAAKEGGVKRILVTHAEWEGTHWSPEDQVRMADMGAFIEHTICPCMPGSTQLNPKVIVDSIKKVSANRSIMATDLGQYYTTHPIEGMREYIRLMMRLGIGEAEINLMTRENPAWLLGLGS